MGSCLEIRASGVRVSDLTLKNYGADLYERNSGVLINEGSKDIVLNGLKIVGTGFGIRADKSEKIHIEGCEIRGNKRKHVLDRGDGVYFNYVKDAVLQNNKVLYTRDGFILKTPIERKAAPITLRHSNTASITCTRAEIPPGTMKQRLVLAAMH